MIVPQLLIDHYVSMVDPSRAQVTYSLVVHCYSKPSAYQPPGVTLFHLTSPYFT